MAQGLAFGAQLAGHAPVLPVDTLLAVAEEARHQHGCTQVLAVLDAHERGLQRPPTWQEATRQWSTDADFGLCAPEALTLTGAALGPWLATPAAYGDRLLPTARHVAALPTATALLRLAPALLVAGAAVPARRRCRATSATRWHKPLPSAKPCAPGGGTTAP